MESVQTSAAPFRSAVDRYERPLIRYAMRIVHDPERARDIVQDTFLRMFESDVSIDDPRLGSWLFTVCRNRAIDVQRKDKRMSSFETPPEISVDGSGEIQRAVSEVFAKVEHLPEKKAEVLELRYRHGRSYRQIADETGLTVSHVGVVIHDGIKFLRRNLAVVAALVLLVGAGTWGGLSSRAPAPEPSYFTRDRPALPVSESAELPPSLDELYGPEPFYGPERPDELDRRRRNRLAPKNTRKLRSPSRMDFPAPMAAPRRAAPPRASPTQVDMYDAQSL